VKKFFLKIVLTAVLLILGSLLVSCSAPAVPEHDVYFKVSGFAESVSVDLATYSSGVGYFSDALDTLSTTVTTLPWTSSNYRLKQGNTAVISCEIYDSNTPTPTILIEIYSDGTLSKSVQVSGNYGSASMQLTL
jgi:hypothetical protein